VTGSSKARSSIDRRFAGAALVMSGGVGLAKLSGFVRDAVIAALHGAGPATDAYYGAFSLPDLLVYMLSGGALSVAFLPIFARHLAEGREDRAWQVFSTVMTTLMVVMVGLILLSELAAPWVVPLMVPGVPPETLTETIRLTRILLPAQFAFLAGGLVQATLYARERFLAPALAPLLYNVGILIGGMLLGPGIDGFAWGALIGAFIGPLGLPLLATRRSIRFRPRIDLTDRDFVEFIKLSLPLMIGFSLLTVDEWLGRWFGSDWEGTLTHLNNARRLMLVPTAILGQAMAMASLPFLARLHAEGQTIERDRVLSVALSKVFSVTSVAAIGLGVLALPAVGLVFGRGAFGLDDVAATTYFLELYCIGIPAWGLQAVAVRAFYAGRDTFTPMVVATAVTIFMLPIYWLMTKWWGPAGIPAAGVLGMWLNAGATLAALRMRGIRPDLPAALVALARAVGLAIPAVLVVVLLRLLARDWIWTGAGELVIGVIGGIPFAVLLAYLVRRRR
jgi:putative peptidoglycan lipid II flippase